MGDVSTSDNGKRLFISKDFNTDNGVAGLKTVELEERTSEGENIILQNTDIDLPKTYSVVFMFLLL